MHQVAVRLRLAGIALGLLLALAADSAFAAAEPLSPWASDVGAPLTDAGVVWYSRTYGEVPLGSLHGYEHVFQGTSTLPVSAPNADYHRFILTGVDGDEAAWQHYSPEGPSSDNLYAELYSGGTAQVLARVPCAYGTPYSGPLASGGTVVWAATPDDGMPYDCRVYAWDGGDPRVVWEVPEGYYWVSLEGFRGNLAAWTASPYLGWEGGPTRLFAWDGAAVEQIAEGLICGVASDGKWVVWVQRLNRDGTDAEIWAWDGSSAFRLSDDSWDCNAEIAVSDGIVAWCGARDGLPADTGYDLFVWQDGRVKQITSDEWMDHSPQIDNGSICWTKDVEHTAGSYYYSSTNVVYKWANGAMQPLSEPSRCVVTSYRDGVAAGLESYVDDAGQTWLRAVQFSSGADVVPRSPYPAGDWSHQFKGQLHAHYMAEHVGNNCFGLDFLDGLPLFPVNLTPAGVAAVYAVAGYDFVAVTEHYGNNQYEDNPLIWDRTDTSALGVRHIWDSMEDTASDSHILGIGFDREAAGLPDWTDGDSAPDSDLMTRLTRVYRIQGHSMGGGLAIVAHPDVEKFRWTPWQIIASEASGIEVFNTGASLLNVVKGGSDPLALDVWDEALRMGRQAIWATAGDDFTVPWPQFDGGYVMAVCDTADPTRDDIMWALKYGSFYACKAYAPGVEAPRINGYWADAEAGDVHLVVPSSNCTIRFATAQGGELLPTSGPVASDDNWEYTYTWRTGDCYVRAEVKDGGGISWTQPIFLDRQASSMATWPVSSASASPAARSDLPLTLDVADAHLEVSTPQSQIGHVYGRVLGVFERPSAPPAGYVGECYEFLPEGVLDGANALTISYDQGDVQVVPAADLAVYRYDESIGRWQSLPTTVDTGFRTATCQIAQLGVYALSGEIGEDTEPPSIEITSPADASSQAGTVTVSATASDNRGVSVVRFSLDDIGLGSDCYGADGWARTSDLSVYPAGSHTITAEAEDASGNRAQTAITISVVSPAPTPVIALEVPGDGETFWIWDDLQVSGSWSDDDPLALGIVALDDMPRAVVVPTTPAEWQGDFRPGPGTEGQRQLRVIGLDQHDNRAEDAHAITLRFFRDMPQDHWAYLDVYKAARAGTVAGYPDGTYQPGSAVTRDQMAVYIARSIATPTGEAGLAAYTPPTTASFPDVPTGYWAYKHIEYCREQGIVAGYWDGYRPQETVNRAQMAVYIARSIVTPTGEAGLAAYTPPATATFPDVATDYWAYKHIEYCKAQSIVSGYWDGYRPEETVTRDQMAVYVARAFQLPM